MSNRNLKRIAASVFAVAVMASLGLAPERGHAQMPRVQAEIHPSGQALFFVDETNGARRALWKVQCRLPLRGCVGKADGLVLWVDHDMGVHLVGPAGPGARISLLIDDVTRDMPGLFSYGLDPHHLEELTPHNARVLIERNGIVLQETRVEGILDVASYLAFLKTGTARDSRDARLWLSATRRTPNAVDNPLLDRYQAAEAQALQEYPHYVPETKPQIEFAIRAQEGVSFHGANGQNAGVAQLNPRNQ